MKRTGKNNGSSVSFYSSYLGELLAEKNSWTQKVPDLTITLSKIGLKIHIRKFLNI